MVLPEKTKLLGVEVPQIVCDIMNDIIKEIDLQHKADSSKRICYRNLIRDNSSCIAGINIPEYIYENVVKGEAWNFLNLDARCAEHSQPCRKCTSAQVLLNQKPSMRAIALLITDNITAGNLGCNILEVSYNVLMRHEGVLSKMYPPKEATSRLNSDIRQTSKMIQGKCNKGHLESIKKVNLILNQELLEGKI